METSGKKFDAKFDAPVFAVLPSMASKTPPLSPDNTGEDLLPSYGSLASED
jgi:hypothetical protein